ncbi:MAG: NERD domain-containing protein [Roseibacillus sp.]
MATMFPAYFPDLNHVDNPEFQVYQLLRELPDSFSVIHSKKLKGGLNCKEETEIDFLIFDGGKNLICLEVKGGEIAYNGSESRWHQNGKPMKRSPDRQASAACHAIIEFLGKDAGNININWALAFPDCSRPAGSGRILEVPDDLILDSTALLKPVDAVQRVCRYNETHHGRPGVKRYQASNILERLLRSVGFVTKIGVNLIRDQSQLVKATEQQLEILEDLELNERTAVMGYAGTGKTIIATEFAKRMSNSGKRVLLLFYNRMVANSVRYGLGRESPIDCATFHSLARREIEASEKSWWKANVKKDDPEFWETEVPLKMLEVLESKTPAYDTIIVDEGQDFKAEWFETLERLLVRNDSSRCVVFYDDNQDIFGRWNNLPWEPNTYTRKRLKKNCRNTKAIIDYLNLVIPSEMIGFANSPAGQPVLLKEPPNQNEESKLIKNDIALFLKEGVEPGKIVILINDSLAESAVSSIQKIGRHAVEWMGRTYRRDSSVIQVTNIENFKGLEADVLLISGLTPQDAKTAPEKLYTQASRARLYLSIYCSASDKPESRTHINNRQL